ncbi:phasin family protein [Sphingomonas sp. BN140010]|uniref:Phasin family protein n=1 Tax=Sphingomonas arvum TaxID=2992113 RepID=A0ABT3JGD8_9SPHN|nr:phasin family protein [Sphingomonas sp. BN140010]MCW3798153.1 phasin family protein [Sphingomonas sp. BN140010]
MDEQNDIAISAGEAEAHHEVVAQPEVLAEVRKVNARRVKTERKPRARKAVNTAAPIDINTTAEAVQTKEPFMNYDPANWMNAFASVPGADKFQTLFADASERGQQLTEKSQKVAGEMVELTRANVEALVETGKIAAAGAQTLGQEAMTRTRETLEQTAQQVRSLAQAGSPTEFFQLQGEIARTQFDRMVADGSRFAESMVKLAGEAFQPISTRTALNVEKLNELTA